MLEIFLKTLPFFALIGCGYLAARAQVFGAEAVASLTKFVFYFALSAMLFNFAASLPLAAIFDARLVVVYLGATLAVYAVYQAVALLRGLPLGEAAVEAQCAVIGNIGFLGLPMLVLLLGEAAAAPLLIILAVDLIVFGSILVMLILIGRGGTGRALWATVGRGLLSNPMVASMAAGLAWSAGGLPIPGPVQAFLDLLGGAATPTALFAIGASLVARSAERVSVAAWLSFGKLVLHPAACAVGALILMPLDPFAAAVMIASAAMPTAGNIYIVAASYGVAPARASSTILISTIFGVATLSVVIALVAPLT